MRLSGLGCTEPQVFSPLRLRLLTCTASWRPNQGFDRVELSPRKRHGPGRQIRGGVMSVSSLDLLLA